MAPSTVKRQTSCQSADSISGDTPTRSDAPDRCTTQPRSGFQFSLRWMLVMTCVLGTMVGLLGPLVPEFVEHFPNLDTLGICLLIFGPPVAVLIQVVRVSPRPISAFVYLGGMLLIFLGLHVDQHLGTILLAGFCLGLGCWVEIAVRGIENQHWPTATAITIGTASTCCLALFAAAMASC